MDWTDHHCRYFLRLISKRALLYSEMVTTGALLYGDSARFLRHDETEHPIALQLGGSNPEQLAACTKMAEAAGFDEVNLNIGCPSDRVQNNMIGACLMAHPQLVADCVRQMQDAVQIPVTSNIALVSMAVQLYDCVGLCCTCRAGCRILLCMHAIAI